MPIGRRGWPFGNPPNVAFRANKNSPQYQGLLAWIPSVDRRAAISATDRMYRYFATAVVGGDAQVTKRLGPAWFFNDNERIQFGDVDAWDMGTQNFSLTAWCRINQVQPDDFSGTKLACVVGKGFLGNLTGYGINLTNEVPAFQIRDLGVIVGVTGSTNINDDNWHLLTGTVDRNSTTGVKIYVDGVEEANNDPTGFANNIDNASEFVIGSRFQILWQWDLLGWVGDVRLYSRSLAPPEVLHQYKNRWELYEPEVPLFQSVLVPTGDLAVTPTVASAIAAAIDPVVALGSATYTPVVADAIASVSAPDVELGSLVVTPGVADAIADVIDPGVIEGSMTITPVTADAIVDVVVPDIVLGSMTATPVFASAIADTVDPDVELSSLIVTPVVADAIADVVDPTASQDSLSLTPGVADAIADTVNPTVELGAMTITPVFASSIVDVVDPNVIGGDTSVTPVFAGAIVSTIAPTVLFGSVAITPVFASAIARTINPTVIGGIGLGLESKLDISIGTIL